MAASDIRTKILDIQVRYQDALDKIAKYRKEVADAIARQKELKKELDEGNISQEEYARQVETTRIFITQQNTAINTLTRQINNQEKAQQENLGSLMQWRAELSNLTAEYDRLSEADRTGEIGENLKAQINDLTTKLKEAEQGTQRFFRNVGNYPNAMGQAANATNGLVEALSKECKTAEEAEDANEVLRRALAGIDPSAEGAADAIKTLNKKIEENNAVIQKYEDQSVGLVDSLGDLVGVNTKFGSSLENLSKNSAGSVLEGLNVKAKALWQTLLGLLSNPYVLAFLGIAGIGMAAKAWYDYNKGLLEATKLTSDLTGKVGNDLKNFRNQVQATADTFNEDFETVLNAANNYAQQYGISVDEALKKIQDGFINGANANGKYLDSLQEFPAYFKEAGVSADGFVAIMSQTSKMGVVGNKALDSIKEANIRIREMSSATAGSLDALGLSSKNILKGLADGSTTTFEVMQQVSAKVAELPESSQAAGEAITNIFGGPGQDAGYNYIATLKDISTNLDEVRAKSGEMARLQEEQLRSQVELDNAIAGLFDMTGGTFESMTTQAKTFVNKGITAIIKGIVDVCNWFIELYNNSLVIRAGVASIGLQFKTLWSVVKNVLGLIVDKIVGLANMIKGAFTLNWDTFSAGWEKFRSASGNALKNIVNETVENTKEAWAHIDKELPKIEIPVEAKPVIDDTSATGNEGGKGTPKNTTKSKSSAADAAKVEAELLRKAEDELLKITTQAAATRRKQLELSYNRQIDDYKKKLAEDKTLTENSKAAILSIIDSLGKQKAQAIAEFDAEEIRKQVEHDSKLIELKLSAAEEGTKQELELKLAAIEQKEKLDLAQAEKDYENETERQEALAAIREKYKQEREAAEDENKNLIVERQKQVLQTEIEQLEIAETEKQLHREGWRVLTDEEMEADRQRKLESIGGYEAEKLQLEEENAQKAYESLIERGQLSSQADAEWLAEQNAAKQEWLNKQVAINEAYVKNEQAKQQAVRAVTNGLVGLLETLGEENSAFAKMAKVITLAQIAIDTGRAISSGVASASALPFPANLAAIATTVATVLANVATAISTVKSAKFATGGKVKGPGSGTSDSIPAMLSNGEYVMTAEATRRFEPLLEVMNKKSGDYNISNLRDGLKTIVPVIISEKLSNEYDNFIYVLNRYFEDIESHRKETIIRDSLYSQLSRQIETFNFRKDMITNERFNGDVIYSIQRIGSIIEKSNRLDVTKEVLLSEIRKTQFASSLNKEDDETSVTKQYLTDYVISNNIVEKHLREFIEVLSVFETFNILDSTLDRMNYEIPMIKGVEDPPTEPSGDTNNSNIHSAQPTAMGFASGGKIKGPGSGTSDSIPVMLSNGEYVITANATRMFEPLLAAMNGIGAGIPIQVANSYQSMDNVEMMTDSFEKAAKEIKPVVSVVEITETQKRVETIENLDNF